MTDDNGSRRRVALITGASSGIGAEFARVLAAQQYDLVLVARRRERLEELAGEVSARHGVATEILTADLSRDEDIAVVARKIATLDRLDLLINNAGFGLLGNFHETALEDQNRMYHVHVIATMRLTHAALPGMMRKDHGAIINVASVAGFTRMPGHASYSSTKSWIIAFTESLHLELTGGRSRVRIQALCPGYTHTEFHDVLGLDRNAVMPSRKYWMSAGRVVEDSLQALRRGRWLVIPGWRYRMLVRFLDLAPRAWLHPLVTRVARRRASAAVPKVRP